MNKLRISERESLEKNINVLNLLNEFLFEEIIQFNETYLNLIQSLTNNNNLRNELSLR